MRVLIIATLVIAKLLSSLGIQVEIKLSREDRPVFYTVPIEVFKNRSKSNYRNTERIT